MSNDPVGSETQPSSLTPVSQSGADGHTDQRSLNLRFPPHIHSFPRANWINAEFTWPVFTQWEDDLKVKYAGRACSRRWMTALNEGSLGSLDVKDFALAVFDKVDEMNSYIRLLRAQLRTVAPCSDVWLQTLEPVIRYAYGLCFAVVAGAFPSSPKLAEFANVEAVLPFVRGAMGSVWREGEDSEGYQLPTLSTYDSSYVDRYIPDPATLPPRPFTKANLDDPTAPEEIIWLNHLGQVVPRPHGVEIRMHGSEPRSSRSFNDSSTLSNRPKDTR